MCPIFHFLFDFTQQRQIISGRWAKFLRPSQKSKVNLSICVFFLILMVIQRYLRGYGDFEILAWPALEMFDYLVKKTCLISFFSNLKSQHLNRKIHGLYCCYCLALKAIYNNDVQTGEKLFSGLGAGKIDGQVWICQRPNAVAEAKDY